MNARPRPGVLVSAGDRCGAAGEQLFSFVLGESAPDAVGLAHAKRVLTALLEHWAAQAHGLGCRVGMNLLSDMAMRCH